MRRRYLIGEDTAYVGGGVAFSATKISGTQIQWSPQIWLNRWKDE
jgi:hypothetical protein